MDISKLPYSEQDLREILNTNIVGFLSRAIGHDINNQLTGIYGYANLSYKATNDESQLKNFLDRVIECSVKAQDITSLLLSLSDRNPNEAIADAVTQVQQTTSAMSTFCPGDCTLNYHPIKDDAAFEVPGSGFREILAWLILWALHQTDNAKIVSVRCSTDSVCGPIQALALIDHVHLIIESYNAPRDDDEFANDSIFKGKASLFFDNTTPITELLASTWGGIISYIDKPEGGVIAQLSFRRNRLLTLLDPHSNQAIEYDHSSRPKLIVLLEDQTMISDFITLLLEEEGHEVISFANGKDLENELDNLPLDAVDVFLFDIYVPGVTGLDAARLVRQRVDDCNLLFYSALTDIAEVERHFTLNKRTRFLQKPFQNEELMATLEQFA